MKIQIDLNGDLWKAFREKVHASGKTLAEVTPTILEPALRCYVETMPLVEHCSGSCEFRVEVQLPEATERKLISVEKYEPIVDRITAPVPVPQSLEVKRCEVCDMPTERFHQRGSQRVCYSCWKKELIQ